MYRWALIAAQRRAEAVTEWPADLFDAVIISSVGGTHVWKDLTSKMRFNQLLFMSRSASIFHRIRIPEKLLAHRTVGLAAEKTH
jgi:hypothetical protein